jgi:hypothetical protein
MLKFIATLVTAIVFATCGAAVRSAQALPASAAPPLPLPSGPVVNVSSEPELQRAVRSMQSNMTIVIAPGTYVLTGTLALSNLTNVGLRGSTGNRDDVILQGPGMTAASSLLFGIWTSNVQGILIADMTIRDFPDHPIIFNAGTEDPHVYDMHLVNAGQQFIKSNPDGAGNGVDGGIVEYSVLEYETTSRDYYSNGIDVIHGIGWNIRHNLFRNLTAPDGQLAGPAVLMWKGSQDTITDGNTFVNCQRGISYGLVDEPGDIDHRGGIIRNNFFVRSPTQPGDVGIMVADSPDTEVLHNTVLLSGTYPNAIEYRFVGTTNVLVANNLVDADIRSRAGAGAILSGNATNATPDLFVDPFNGDLHLQPSAVLAIDRVAVQPDALLDFDNRMRPQGIAADIGAHEVAVVSSPAGRRR